jgi:hypothetical protein
MNSFATRSAAVTLFTVAALALIPETAGARGTARIQQRDGTVKVYHNVLIRIRNEALALTSSDGQGTLVIGKAACLKVEQLVKCIPYEATLLQHGESHRVRLASGTAWFNPTTATQKLSYSSTQLPPHGVMLSVETKNGTYVSLTGTVDQIVRQT